MKSTRILVVDDDTAVLHALKRVLEPHYSLCCTSSPREAPDLAASFDPDIAICDVQMPHISGFELLDALRGAATDVDVILMTGSITDQDTHLIRALRERAFYFILKPFERDVLLALVERCEEMQRLRRAERGHLHRMREELLAAQAFQQAMLAPVHAIEGDFTIDVLCKPCSEVGGDFYDYARTPAGDLAFMLADVRGHGVPAALLTATVKTLFRNAVLKNGEPRALADSLVQALQHFSADQFLTAFCGRVSSGGQLEYVNAGHPAGVLLDPTGNNMQLLHATAPILCAAFPPASWQADHTQLAHKSSLLLHTDGFSPGLQNTQSDLAKSLKDRLARDSHANDRLKLLASIAQHTSASASPDLADDVTLMLLQRA